MTTETTPVGNSSNPKEAVHWLNQALYFYQSLCLVDSLVIRIEKSAKLIRHIRVIAKREA
ncbi:MAG: hypothetical protein IPK11_16350 [Ignavibacteria bacterium]|mgnify:FL=1|nr:hypothetical protein [Ignavibacteria bacterium]